MFCCFGYFRLLRAAAIATMTTIATAAAAATYISVSRLLVGFGAGEGDVLVVGTAVGVGAVVGAVVGVGVVTTTGVA